MAKLVTPHPKPQHPRHYVKEWRKHKHLTQEKLAERSGVTHGAISQLESGKTNYTQGMLEALAGALGCEPGDLLLINPLVAGEVVDISALLRGTSPQIVHATYAFVQAMMQTGTGGPEAYYQPQDADEGPHLDGPNRSKERRTNR